MSLAVHSEGSQTATLTTEHTLATITTGLPKTLVLGVDAGALADGETLTLRIYSILRSGGTERLDQEAVFVHQQGVPIKRSIPVPADVSFKATLRQDGGTGRAFPWKIWSLD
jgi:hypothetical protein